MCFALAEMQALLKELLTTVPPTRLANLPGMRTLIESLLPYSERHKARMEKLIRSSYLLDYTLREIKIASAVDGAAPSTAAVAHLAPAPVAHLAPPAAPGPRFRRADIDGPARPAGDAGMEDGTEFETLELDEEIEEKAKEQAEAGSAAHAAAPVVPLANGTSRSSAPRSVPEPRVLGPDSRSKGTEKKTKISSSDTSNVQKRPRGQEVGESEKTARQDGMADVSIATASSSSTFNRS